jgi:GNAT superfamily N-acetyltransferase
MQDMTQLDSRLGVTPVLTRRDLSAFVGFPYALHAGDKCWAPPLRREVRRLLSPRHNAFFEHAEAGYFLARSGRQVVGRVAAIHNRRHNEFHQDAVGFFGLFESVDDQAVARALLDAAAGWLRRRGLAVMRGPVSFSTNEEAGLLVDGFETPGVLMMPYNPAYYVGLLETAGFVAAKDMLSFQTTSDQLPERLVRGAQSVERRYGVTTRTMDPSRFDDELETIRRLFNAAWERNWGFVPFTEPEFTQMVQQLRPIVEEEVVVLAEHQARPVGVGVAVPDMAVALRANPSGRLFPGILKVLWASRGIQRLRVIILGALPEWRSRGIDVLLYKRMWEGAWKKGYRWAEAGWVLEENRAMCNGLERMGFEAYKRYRLYDRDL